MVATETGNSADFANGDLVSSFEDSTIYTFKAGAAMTKGDIVSLTTTNPTAGELNNIQLAGVYSAGLPTIATSCIGVITGTKSGQVAFASGDMVPVIMDGVTVLTSSTAVILAGMHVCVAVSSTGAFTIKVVPALASADADHRSLIDETFGYAITDFSDGTNGNRGYVRVSK